MNRKLGYILPVFITLLFAFMQKASVSFASIVPTLEKLKTESAAYRIETPFVLSQPSETDGLTSVEIGDVKYYFDAEDDSFAEILAFTPAGKLIEVETPAEAIFYNPVADKYYKFDISSIPPSVWSLKDGTVDDYHFFIPVIDKAGVEVGKKYYHISLSEETGTGEKIKIGTSSRVEWEEVSDVGADTIIVKLPNNDEKYFKYTYTPEEERITITTRQNISTLKDAENNIDKDFLGNYFSSNGGAIVNTGIINNITGDFIGNYISGSSSVFGGAIYNAGTGKIDNIIGDFIGNYASSTSSANPDGGAICNVYGATIGNITGNFIGNYTNSTTSHATGGAILNDRTSTTIGNITGNFIGNYAKSNVSFVRGGAIYNSGTAKIDNIIGSFIGNYVSTQETYGSGGAIYNVYGTIGKIIGDFIGNYALGSADANGGAIYNTQANSTIGNITGNFVGNYAQDALNTRGGAICNDKSILGDITGDFIKNYASGPSNAYGGAIHNTGTNSMIGNITGDFIGNYASGPSNAQGGAIYNTGTTSTIGDITGSFVDNYTSSLSNAYGGAIYNTGTTGNIIGNFVGNYALGSTRARGGVIYNASVMSDITGDFIGNYTLGSESQGGAIYNSSGTIGNITGNFIGNYAKSNVNRAFGGAIYNTDGTITLSTTNDKKSILFENNHVITFAETDDEIKKLNSINLLGTSTILNLVTIADSYVNIRDPITSLNTSSFRQSQGFINKTGLGALYLWGDNSEYGGTLNINEGDFYAMFEQTQDLINDPLGQRTNFTLANATVNFADGTSFRPMMTSSKMAKLGTAANINFGDVVKLVPYHLSSFDAGQYYYENIYSEFSGWESDLAKVDIQSDGVTVEVKHNLGGYQGLGTAADAYRKQSLSLAERTIFDNIYYTGEIPADVKENFKEVIKVISGEDKIIINEVHRSSIRQFSRQISSRIQNKDCPSCGILEGFSDEHLWFNIGKNFIERDTSGENVGYKYEPTSLAIGYDHDLIPDTLNMGIAFSYAFGDVRGKGHSIYNTAETDEYMLSLYWKYKPIRAYMTGSIGGGYMKNKTQLRGDSIDVWGNYDTYAAFINTEFGYDFGNTCGVFEPFVGFEYAYLYSKAYTERGLGARHFAKSDYHSVEVPIGLRVSRNLVLDSYIITPSIELAYSRSLGDRRSEINSYFVGSPESPWVMRGASDSRDSLRGGLNLKINNVYNPFALNFGYARDSRSNYKDDQIYFTVRYNF